MRRSLTHPVLLAATALLLLNDHVWKAAYGNALTGKLSDVAGLLAFAWCTAALLPQRRWARLLAFIGTGIGFAWYKSATADGFIEWWSAWLYPIARVVDPTDLWALPILPLGYAYFSRVDRSAAPVQEARRRWWGLAAKPVTLAVCFVAFAATSDDEGDWGPFREVWTTVDAPRLSTRYVISRTADELLDDHFSPGGRLPDALRSGGCFLATYAVAPPEGFVDFSIATRSNLTGSADSSVFAITAISNYRATIDTAFYGPLTFATEERATADLEAISVDSALRLLELDVVTRMRIGAAFLPARSLPDGRVDEREVAASPCP